MPQPTSPFSFKWIGSVFVTITTILVLSGSIVKALPRGHDYSSKGSNGDEVSGTFYKDFPFDDSYPDPNNTKQQSASDTDATITAEGVYQFTRTWPATPEPTGSTRFENDNTFPDPEYIR